MAEWKEYKLGDFMEFNPKIKLAKNTLARKISMDQLVPHCRDIHSWSYEPYTGGAKFENGDTIMARITPCLENGKHAFISCLEKNEVAYGSTEYIVIRGRKEISDNDFVYYLSHFPDFKNAAIKSMVGTSGRQRAQVDVLENLTMNLPSLAEQRQIASILSSLDDKIENNRRINANLEAQAQALFKSWFVDFEPFKDQPFVESELGMIPEGWRVGEIGDYCNIRSGFAFKSSWWSDNGIKVIKIKNITEDGRIDISDCSFVSKEHAMLAKEFQTKVGDLLIAMTGATIGKFCIIPTDTPMCVNQRVGKFFLGDKPLEKLPFIYYNLKRPNIFEEIVRKGQGSAQPNISGKDIESIKLVFPPDSIISRFNQSAIIYIKMGILNEQESRRLASLRDALLPRLMSGELKVNDVNI